MTSPSSLAYLGLPESFGYALLLLGLVLSLAPYLRGSDFGFLKIPDFDAPMRRTLRIAGPFVLLAAVLLHAPLSDSSGRVQDQPDDAEGSFWFWRLFDRQPMDPAEPLEVTAADAPTTGRFLAPRNGGRCLYPVTLLDPFGEEVRVRFAFGQDGSVRAEDLTERRDASPGSVGPGDLVFIYLPGAAAWAPGEVKELRAGQRILVDLDPAADCASQYDRPYIWVNLNENSIFKQES